MEKIYSNLIRAGFSTDKETWKRFFITCKENDRTASAVLNELMKKYIKGNKN